MQIKIWEFKEKIKRNGNKLQWLPKNKLHIFLLKEKKEKVGIVKKIKILIEVKVVNKINNRIKK